MKSSSSIETSGISMRVSISTLIFIIFGLKFSYLKWKEVKHVYYVKGMLGELYMKATKYVLFRYFCLVTPLTYN